jgi:hypothetical protein
MKQATLLISLALTASCYGFQTTTSRAAFHIYSTKVASPTKLAFAPENLNDLQSVLEHSQAWTYLADAAQATLDPSGGGLMDAIDAIPMPDDVADAAAKVGWWKQYLNLFKAALLLIHDTIDPPLRDMGITQTWGISIALFTASELYSDQKPTL